MKQMFFKIPAAAALTLCMCGCSLFKLSVSTGDPLPKDDLRARIATRGFYNEMRYLAISAADSIAAHSDGEVRIRALRWKMDFTRKAVAAVMQSNPQAALADTWILCRNTERTLAATPDSLLFGSMSFLAIDAADSMHRGIVRIAESTLPRERFLLMQRFVEDYTKANPASGFAAPDITWAWSEFLKANQRKESYAIGTIPEVLSDMSDKINGQTQQIAGSIGWSGEILALRLKQDSLLDNMQGRMDSLDGYAGRAVSVLENIPGMSDEIMASIERHVAQLMESLNGSVDNAFERVDVQRRYLERFVDVQRSRIAEDADSIVQHAVNAAADAVPRLAGKITLWIILLATMILGLPFAAGFLLGWMSRSVRMRGKEK